jgi:cellulose biosynthesis operon protein BcsF/YhjT
MNINDILEIIVLCAIFVFLLSYYFHNTVKRALQKLKFAIFSPRYLKKVGVLRSHHSDGVKSSHDQ